MSKDISKYVPTGEMADYLQMYLDETGEQLEALVEKLLALEKNPADAANVNDAFRLVHTIKGSSALMGFESVTEVTHQLENHFERVRSGSRSLDRGLMDLSLRCVDFLRECNRRMREGEALGRAPELLEALRAVGAAPPAVPPPAMHNYRLLIHFEPGLPLVDLKAQLAVARLAALGVVQRTLPGEKELARLADQMPLQVLLESERSAEEIRQAADVAGVALIEVEEGACEFLPSAAAKPMAPSVDLEEEVATTAAIPIATAAVEPTEAKAKLAETVRVDIDRLDNLMNLAGELVVNKARFVQIARQMSPAFKKSSLAGRTRAFGESMRRALLSMKAHDSPDQDSHAANWSHHLTELEAEIGAIEEQARLWEESRRHFGHVTEAIDQLTRVSDSLQRGVLNTRMVPVAPLFNRFKRVVRDISLELNKKVNLEIKGEKTELDKRMIDELGDPLIHLVRNSIDHGIESAELRARRGKPDVGSICLEAAHSGNNVFIYVRDDGGGIDTDKIRQRVSERGLVAPGVLDSISPHDLIEFIWHPGFSTAEVVSDISGRGVGMDIVKTAHRRAQRHHRNPAAHRPGDHVHHPPPSDARHHPQSAVPPGVRHLRGPHRQCARDCLGADRSGHRGPRSADFRGTRGVHSAGGYRRRFRLARASSHARGQRHNRQALQRGHSALRQ